MSGRACPQSVMRSGSPPKAAMLSLVHSTLEICIRRELRPIDHSTYTIR